MDKDYSSRLISAFKLYAEYTGIAIIIIGSGVLIGWVFDIPFLKSIHPDFVSMKANTALSFMLMGISLFLLQRRHIGRWSCDISRGCGFLVALIGTLTMVEYVFGVDMGIDQLLFKDISPVGTTLPGRMAPATALVFCLLGVALFLSDMSIRGYYPPSQYLALIAGLLPLLSCVGYLYDVEPLTGLQYHTKMALHTAIAFVLSCSSLLLAYPDRGLMGIITSKYAGGILSRRLLLPVIVVVPLLGWLRLLGQQANLYTTEFGLSMVVVMSIVIITTMIWLVAASLNRKDIKNEEASELIRISEANTTAIKEQLQSILDYTPAIVYMKNRKGCYLLVNRTFENRFTLLSEQIIGKTDYDIFPREIADVFLKNDLKVLNAKKPMEFDEDAPWEDGVRSYLSVKFPLFDAAGTVYAVCGISTDITERKLIEKALYEANESLQLIIQTSPLAIIVQNAEGRVKVWNKAAEYMFGWNGQEVIGGFPPMIPEYLRMEHTKMFEEEIKGRAWSGLELRLQKKDDSIIDTSLWSTPLHDYSGKIFGSISIYADVSERKRAEAELQKLSSIVSQSTNIIFTTDVHGNIEYVNSMFEQVTGYSKAEITGKNTRILASENVQPAFYAELWNTILSGNTWRGVLKNKSKQGKDFYVNGLIAPICDKDGSVINFLAIQEDVTEKMLNEERERYRASYDGLTGLLNRSRFIEVLNDWVYGAKSHYYIGSLLLIDIDGFRLINDTFGRGTGDAILKRVAELLEEVITESDERFYQGKKDIDITDSLVCRLGGDEFAVFLPARDEQEGIDTALAIRKEISDFQHLDEVRHITASIGIAVYPKHGITINELFTKADAAIYHAKKTGQNTTHVYHPEDLVLEKMRSRITGKDHIIHALKDKRFMPWYQPILDLKEGTIHHYESLARMQDEEGGIVLPASFINIAEIFGFVSDIDKAIIENVFAYTAKLKDLGRKVSFSINLSGKEIGDKELLKYINRKIEELKLETELIVFEITETEAVQGLDSAIYFIRNLKAMGCKFSLDDFGVGFTSFKYLKEMEVDFIKIDGSFIRKIHESPSDRLFVKSMVDVARGLGVKTIAEFVENGEIVAVLKELGVDYAQGYFIGKPAPEVLG